VPHSGSFIRWAGGKAWFVPHFKEYTTGLEFNKYFEPFLGGASVFFSLEGQHQAFLSDANEELMRAYIVVRDYPDEVVSALKLLKNKKEEYYRIRDWIPNSDIEKAVRFLYLNYTSFNGIYRVNSAGVYNVPYGFRNIEFDYKRLWALSVKLKKAVMTSGDFEVYKERIGPKDLVFLDPPYSVSQKPAENGFIKYNAKLFSLDEQYRLSRYIDYIKECGAYYLLTNSAHETIAEIFEKGDRRVSLQRSCSIGGKNAHRGQVLEYLLTNIPKSEVNSK
jgi:DNA adenine methylase